MLKGYCFPYHRATAGILAPRLHPRAAPLARHHVKGIIKFCEEILHLLFMYTKQYNPGPPEINRPHP